MSSRKTRKRGRASSQTTETIQCTRGHSAGKKRKEDDPLMARDIPQIVQAVVDTLRGSSRTSGGGDNGDEPRTRCTLRDSSRTDCDGDNRDEPQTSSGTPIDGQFLCGC